MRRVISAMLVLAAGCATPEHDAEVSGSVDPTPTAPEATPTEAPTATPGPTQAPEPSPAATPTPSPTPQSDAPQVTSITLAGDLHADDAQGGEFQVTLDAADGIALVCDEQQAPYERHKLDLGTAQVHDFALHGLRAGSVYSCFAWPASNPNLTSSVVELVTPPLPANLLEPVINVSPADLSSTGYTIFNFARQNSDMSDEDCYLVIIDPMGEVRWHYDLGECGSDLDVSYVGNDRVLIGGSAYPVHFPPTIVGLGKDEQYMATWQTVAEGEAFEGYHHDAGLSQDGKSIFTMTATQHGDYQGFIIKQIDIATDSVVWFWDSEEDGVKKGLLPAGSAAVSDPYHANAVVDRWEDGKLYVYLSVRDQNQVIKIDYQTRGFVWKLGIGGDFTLLEADGSLAESHRWFSGQHDAKPYRDGIMLHDNGSTLLYGSTSPTRALQLRLDEKARKAWIVFEYAEPNWSEPVWGGFDMLPNGGTLIAMGHCWRCGAPEGHGSAMVELSPEGKVVWRAEFDDDDILLYRAERIDGCNIFRNQSFCSQF